jgi:hypothetical protein
VIAALSLNSQPQRWQDLQGERGQLIERVENLQACQYKRCDHQIGTEVHGVVDQKFLAACASRP